MHCYIASLHNMFHAVDRHDTIIAAGDALDLIYSTTVCVIVCYTTGQHLRVTWCSVGSELQPRSNPPPSLPEPHLASSSILSIWIIASKPQRIDDLLYFKVIVSTKIIVTWHFGHAHPLARKNQSYHHCENRRTWFTPFVKPLVERQECSLLMKSTARDSMPLLRLVRYLRLIFRFSVLAPKWCVVSWTGTSSSTNSVHTPSASGQVCWIIMQFGPSTTTRLDELNFVECRARVVVLFWDNKHKCHQLISTFSDVLGRLCHALPFGQKKIRWGMGCPLHSLWKSEWRDRNKKTLWWITF